MADDDTTEGQQSARDADDDTTDQTGRADVPPEVKRALNKANREAQQLRQKLAEYEDRDKTDLQRLTEAQAAAEKRAAAAESELLRHRVAAAKKLPPELVDRLRGATEDELAADADSLLKLVGAATTRTDFDGGARTTADRPTDMNQIIRRQAGVS